MSSEKIYLQAFIVYANQYIHQHPKNVGEYIFAISERISGVEPCYWVAQEQQEVWGHLRD